MSQAAIVKATNLQTQQSAEIEKLKVTLAEETANVEREYNAKLEASKERLIVWNSLVARKLVGQ